MNNKNWFIATIFIIAAILYILYNIIEGIVYLVFIVIGVLISLTSLSVFIKRNYPNSKIARAFTKIIGVIQEFFEDVLGWV